MNASLKWTAVVSTLTCFGLVGWLVYEPHVSAQTVFPQQQQAQQTEQASSASQIAPQQRQASAVSRYTQIRQLPGINQQQSPAVTIGTTQQLAAPVSQSAQPTLVSRPGQQVAQTPIGLPGPPIGSPAVAASGFTSQQSVAFPTVPGMAQQGFVMNSSEELEKHQETMRLVNAIRESQDDDDQREELVAELEDVLNEHFDLRMQTREKELEELEERISHLREELDSRLSAKNEIVELRLQSLVNEAIGLGF